ncbi:hypothetical protein L1987_09411 [Smallanthus sonchifolius]|uniref:Uncharacterized protein n=1 Tax=Smallanthus sonchifolius TaxID=185202 RepID=A0ACB9JPL4_9ASTR|nr:hypothetical protein L1987_09411 [Smallanthus sonchifolius]
MLLHRKKPLRSSSPTPADFMVNYLSAMKWEVELKLHGRKATVSDFYAVILPSLKRLHYDLVGLDNGPKEESPKLEISGLKRLDKDEKFTNIDNGPTDAYNMCIR